MNRPSPAGICLRDPDSRGFQQGEIMKHDRRISFLYKPLLAVALMNVLAATALAQTWSTKSPMPGTRYAFASCVAGSKLYAFGGYDGAHIDTVVAYDPVTNSW